MNIKQSTYTMFCLTGLFLLTGCSGDDEILKDNELNRTKTCKLILNVTKSAYDEEADTRSATSWENGDKIYLTFDQGGTSTYGEATYNNGNWNLSYAGILTEGKSSQCTAVYFDNAEYVSGSVVNLSENTGIYEDSAGSYVYTDGSLSVTANLKPKTGRIRFAGNSDEEITLYGISHYCTYDYSTGKYIETSTAIPTKVSKGYTPYIYGMFTDTDRPCVNVLTSESGFTRMAPTTIYQAGQSGYMTVPTLSSHSGWQNRVVLKVNGVEFSMIPVEYSEGNFFLAETETTNELWKAIMNNGTDNQKPVYSKYESEWITFLNEISILTGLNFRLPTVGEWQYAYSGGNKSQGYTYSGSNQLSKVGWYKDNSQNTCHPVKELQPNELGFYDMSGNVAELVSTEDSYARFYGGYWGSSADQCEKSSYITYMYYGGCRIAMSIK